MATTTQAPPDAGPSDPVSHRSRQRALADDYGLILLGAAALVWLALEYGGYGGVPRHLAGVVVWLVVFGLVMARGTAALPHGPVLVVAAAIATLTGITGLSLFWTESVGRSFHELTRVLLFLGVFSGVAAIGASCARRRGQLLEALTLGMTAVIAVAVLSRLEPTLFPDQQLGRLAPEFRPRLAYPLGYWNAVGSFVAIAIPLLLHAASRVDRPRAYRAAATAVLPVAGLALYLTFSRASLFAAAVAAALLLWLSPRRVSAFASIIIGAVGTAPLVLIVRSYGALNEGLLDQADARAQGHRVLVAVVIVSALAYAARVVGEHSALPGRFMTALAPHGRKLAIAAGVLVLAGALIAAPRAADRLEEFREPVVVQGTGTETGAVGGRLASGSGNGRYQFWKASVDAWQSRPVVGRGAGTWEFWWRRNATIDSPTRDSHSLFFDMLAELGTLGFAAVLAMVGTALWFCFRGARRARSEARPALAAVAAGASAWTIGAAVDWSWEVTALTVPFFALAALGAAAAADQRRSPASGAARRRSPAVAVVAVVAWLVVAVQAVGLTSTWSVQRSHAAVARGDYKAAEDAAELARSVEPWSADAWMQLSLVRIRVDSTGPSAIEAARKAVEREPTNWRTWLNLVRIEARAGRLDAAARHNAKVAELARGSALVPTYDELRALSESTDLSLSPERRKP